ncbi:hypothetical protein [Streptomyces sp. NBC_00690]|uniref:hypothetical protein n=1 Tax=Streptomyces sp. NBC_00690 TaxID=2975808 RepID=UPI002E2C089A|nr:hypothetical protein [Streptomyces sp. NBC_00690]
MPSATTLSPAPPRAVFHGTVQPWRSLTSLGIDPLPLDTRSVSTLDEGQPIAVDDASGASDHSGPHTPLVSFPSSDFLSALTGRPGPKEA